MTGAVLVDGPKAVGKTFTATRVVETVLRVDVDRAVRAALEVQPEQLFTYPTPILFDEWQEVPELWNLVRRAVDDHVERGLYVLTGSARPRDDARLHSGAGRIGRLRMRPMSLYETGHSSGKVSLEALLAGAEPTGAPAELTVADILERVVIGGWRISSVRANEPPGGRTPGPRLRSSLAKSRPMRQRRHSFTSRAKSIPRATGTRSYSWSSPAAGSPTSAPASSSSQSPRSDRRSEFPLVGLPIG